MARHATIIGTTLDREGFPWDIRESRPTSHGFDLHFGWPHAQRGKGYGGPRLIPTPELYRYWAADRLARDGRIYDLPCSHTALRRARRIFGFNLYLAHQRWWIERLDDLCNLSGAEFARKHAICEPDVSKASRFFFGSRQRPNYWYLEPKTFALLVSDLPHAFISVQLGISIGASRRLRFNLRRIQPRIQTQ